MSQSKISFEFFPPRSEVQSRRFWTTLGCLQTLNPEYISMTWGALGTSSQASVDVLEALVADAQVPVAAHLTCVGHTERSMRDTISMLEKLGVSRFVALRGDQPAEERAKDSLQHASQLVEILADSKGRDISVAAYPELHPESQNSTDELHWLKHKLDAGANRAITQFFFSADTFLRFRDQALKAGINQELVPGILPIHDIEKVQGFANQCGASVPQTIVERFSKSTDQPSKEDCSVTQCVELIESLQSEGVESFHLYTLNQSRLSYRICSELKGSAIESGTCLAGGRKVGAAA